MGRERAHCASKRSVECQVCPTGLSLHSEPPFLAVLGIEHSTFVYFRDVFCHQATLAPQLCVHAGFVCRMNPELHWGYLQKHGYLTSGYTAEGQVSPSPQEPGTVYRSSEWSRTLRPHVPSHDVPLAACLPVSTAAAVQEHTPCCGQQTSLHPSLGLFHVPSSVIVPEP